MRDCDFKGSVTLSVVTDCGVTEQDPVAEEGEAGAAVHLPLDHLGLFCVDSFDAAVVVRHRERGGGGPDIQVEAAGEGVHAGGLCAAGRARHHPARSPGPHHDHLASSRTSSMTSADNPENTVPTSSVTSLMTHRDRKGHLVTTESAAEPFQRCNFRYGRRHQITDVTEDRDQASTELPAADEQLLRELTGRARSGGLELTGEGGLLGKLTRWSSRAPGRRAG